MSFIWLGVLTYLQIIFFRYERYERALLKGHKESLDRGDSKENIDIDSQKYKAQVMQLMQEGNKLRYLIFNSKDLVLFLSNIL